MQVYQYPYQSRIQRQGIKEDKERHFTLIKGLIFKEILTIKTFSAADNTALQYIKQTVRNQDSNSNKIIVREFKILLWALTDQNSKM